MNSNRRLPLSRRKFLASAAAGAAAVGISFKLPKGAMAADGKVNFYNWDTYIGENTISEFEGSSGIEVQYDLFADNDELFAKLRGGNPGYDVIVPTNDYVERMIVADMLMELDHARIPNMANIDENFLDPSFDPGRKFSLPYMWGTIGIGYRKSAVDGVPASWNDILTSDKYAGRIALMSEPQTVLQIAMKAMGKSLNDWTDENIAAALPAKSIWPWNGMAIYFRLWKKTMTSATPCPKKVDCFGKIRYVFQKVHPMSKMHMCSSIIC